MPEQDIDHKFGEAMVRIAPEDAEFSDIMHRRIYGLEDSQPSQEEIDLVDGLTRWQYPMSSAQLTHARARTIASLIPGVEMGEDIFRE